MHEDATHDFAAMLAKKYGASTPVGAQPNARRVIVRGMPCVAKLIVHRSERGVHRPGGISAKSGFDTEREVYRRLEKRHTAWPVRIVDAFRARSGNTTGYVVVTSEFRGAAPWDAYVPSATRDAAVSRQLMEQTAAVHRAGFVHWDLFLKNVLFAPPRSVAVIDFEKAEACTDRDTQRNDYITLASEFAGRPNTRGIALRLLRAFDSATAKLAFEHMLHKRRDDSELE